MFKKSMLLSITLSVFANFAQASCNEAYTNQVKVLNEASAPNGVGISSTGAGVGYTAAVLADGKGGNTKIGKVIKNPETAISGAATSSGVIATAKGLLDASDLNSALSLLREADIGQGLYLQRVTRQISSSVGKIRSSDVAEKIRSLNEREIFCENELMSVSEITELVTAELLGK